MTQLLSSLADPDSLEVLLVMRHGEHTVDGLAAGIDVPVDVVAQRLRGLVDAGVVEPCASGEPLRPGRFRLTRAARELQLGPPDAPG